nr:probable G-protein coupled receptor 21 [Lytechinus pictus]
MLVYVSIVHFLLITADRLISLTKPLHYASLVATRRVRIAVFFVWAGGITYGIVSVIESGNREDNTLTQFCTGERYTSESTRNFFVGSASYILFSSIVLMLFNFLILRIALNHSRRMQQHAMGPPRQAWQGGQGQQQYKAAQRQLCLLWVLSASVGSLRAFGFI